MDAELAQLMEDSGDVPDTYQPPEELLDREDPANDRFFRSLANRRSHVNILCNKMRPKHVQLARLRLDGKTNKEIAERLGYRETTVSALSTREDIRELTDHLRRVNALIDGPNLAVRKNLLWRIAANNEQTEPAVTLAAVRELNKIDGAYQEKTNQPANVTVIINQELLPKTELDHHDG